MDITLVKLYNSDVKLTRTLKRTQDKKYKYIKQITHRNMHTTEVYDSIEDVKSEIFCDIINGYQITQNLLGLDLIDSILAIPPCSRPSSPILNYTSSPPGCIETSNSTSSEPALCVSELHHPQEEDV